MKKRLFGLFLIVAVCMLNITPLLAATKNSVKVVSQNDARKQLSPDGANILNTINLEKSDLKNGKVAIDIIIDNSKSTEVYYVIDNGTGMTDIKGSVIDLIKTESGRLESDMSNLSQGVVITSNNERTFIEADNKNITTQLESIRNISVGSESIEVKDAFDYATSKFNNATVNKVIVAFVTDADSAKLEEFKTSIAQAKATGITVLAYKISSDTTTDTDFTSIVNSSEISNISFSGNIVTTLPSELPAVAVKISFDNYILDNFTIKDITSTVGSASLNDNEVVWGVGNISGNKVVTLSYMLEVKDNVDESLINKLNLRTNRQIVVTQNGTQVIGTYPADDKIDDEVCSPTIMLLEKGSSIDNPNTGIADYIIPGACLMAVALITLVILNNKNEFNRI